MTIKEVHMKQPSKDLFECLVLFSDGDKAFYTADTFEEVNNWLINKEEDIMADKTSDTEHDTTNANITNEDPAANDPNIPEPAASDMTPEKAEEINSNVYVSGVGHEPAVQPESGVGTGTGNRTAPHQTHNDNATNTTSDNSKPKKDHK